MLDVLRAVFHRQEQSKTTARDRLRYAISQDRLALSPAMLDAMRQDVLAVISRYMEVGDDFTEFEIRNAGSSIALISNLRVREVKRRSGGGAAPDARTDGAWRSNPRAGDNPRY